MLTPAETNNRVAKICSRSREGVWAKSFRLHGPRSPLGANLRKRMEVKNPSELDEAKTLERLKNNPALVL
ncbi:hypothetical protein K443DRAFT_492385 [Laccaria amethystina LaAM-08-1]|uniref:Uncharacterized protein n=1 Tax=Laccaria amethystina LaAM-08-1 TaxID=1095629 RepID=A0A0C9X406_9AGAR|nr:hypothetical protein K443DRAFT_492385 [Laccaria amethystina LaAM-08-1]